MRKGDAETIQSNADTIHAIAELQRLLKSANLKVNNVIDLHQRSHLGSCKECGGRFPCRTIEAATRNGVQT